jgi:hypothetical protein
MRQRIESYLEQLHQAIQQEDMQTLRAAIRSLLQALPQNATPSQGISAQSHIPE